MNFMVRAPGRWAAGAAGCWPSALARSAALQAAPARANAGIRKGSKPMILQITLTMAGAAAILHVWLSLRVSPLRRQLQIGYGDGGNEVLLRRMRAHANFAENVPIFLILLGLIELAIGGNLVLWTAGILFILARIAHAFGMDRPGANPLRVGGITVSWLVLLAMGGYAILIAYQSPPISTGVTLPAGRSAAFGTY
jgi:uncharacterized membrane protein YecN with MAPEG domain